MKFTPNLIALAIGLALAAPAIAQQGTAAAQVGGSVQAQTQPVVPTQVPAPVTVPPVSPEIDHGRSAKGAMNNATQATKEAGSMQDETGTPPPSPEQSQGAENAAANSSVVQRDLWNRLDADHDGTISSTEASVDAGFNGHFAAMDSNGDGMVGSDEYTAYAKANMNTGGQNANAGSQASTKLTWNNVDTDKDGKLSSAEADGYANLKSNFAGMDSNGDGFVTQDEYRAYAKANREPGKP